MYKELTLKDPYIYGVQFNGDNWHDIVHLIDRQVEGGSNFNTDYAYDDAGMPTGYSILNEYNSWQEVYETDWVLVINGHPVVFNDLIVSAQYSVGGTIHSCN